MSTGADSPWLRVGEAAARARCGRRVIYQAVRRGELRAARIGARRDLRIHIQWIDQWLEESAAPREIRRAG
jgi:excisionase family DNA binding protein